MSATETTALEQIARSAVSKKSFSETCEALERLCPEKQFRVLAVHDVQATLKEKGFEREPIRIIEVCNAGFANEALQKNIHVSLFMPCKFVVSESGGEVTVTLGRPSVISQLLPGSGLESLAEEVEGRLSAIMDEVVG